MGDPFGFDDHAQDLSGLDLVGLDEVWAIALHDKKLTVLRFMRSGDDWEHRADLEVS